MAEYLPLLERAVAGLPNSTPETRRALYERARTALLGQLRSSDPPIPDSDIERESVALDDAIARVESDARARDAAARSAPEPAAVPPPITPGLPSGVRPAGPRPRPPVERPSPGAPAPAAAAPAVRERPAYPFRNLDPGAGAARPAPPVRPLGTVDAEAQSDRGVPRLGAAVRPADALAPVPDAVSPPEQAVVRADETPETELSPDAVAPVPGDATGPRPATAVRRRARDTATVRPAAPVPASREPRRRTALYALVATLAILAGAVAILAYVLRDRPEQIVAARPDVTIVDDSPGKTVKRADAPPPSTPTAEQPPQAPAGPSSPPAPADEATTPATPIPQGSERASRGPQATAETSTDQTANPAAPAEPAISVAQRAGMLVDAPEEAQKVRTYSGTVVWRLESISAGQGQPLSNAIRADVEIPEAKVAMSMVLKRNVEPQFPASHTIEFHFVEQPGNTLGPVKQINVPELRRDDAAPAGDPLAGVPVSITDDYFLVGLSRGAAEASNLQLLTQRNWIDVSIMLSSGKIAKIAFEKGAPGQKILEDALASWH